MSYRGIETFWSWDIEPFYEFIAAQIPRGGTFVEVGVFLGRSLAFMGELRPDIELYAIDPWADGTSAGYDGPSEYQPLVDKYGSLWMAFLKGMLEHAPAVLQRTHVVRTRSALAPLISADVVFLDGAHDRSSVLTDISTWSGRTKILAGHDYDPVAMHPHNVGVVQAVNETWGGQHKMGPDREGIKSTCWWVDYR